MRVESNLLYVLIIIIVAICCTPSFPCPTYRPMYCDWQLARTRLEELRHENISPPGDEVVLAFSLRYGWKSLYPSSPFSGRTCHPLLRAWSDVPVTMKHFKDHAYSHQDPPSGNLDLVWKQIGTSHKYIL